MNTLWKIATGAHVPYPRLLKGVEKETTLVQIADSAMQSGEAVRYRVYCYSRSAPAQNFELFYAELNAGCSNASIGHSEKAQEYLYVIQGTLEPQTDTGNYTLRTGDALMFDATIGHTYVNRLDTPLTFLVMKYYPGQAAGAQTSRAPARCGTEGRPRRSLRTRAAFSVSHASYSRPGFWQDHVRQSDGTISPRSWFPRQRCSLR